MSSLPETSLLHPHVTSTRFDIRGALGFIAVVLLLGCAFATPLWISPSGLRARWAIANLLALMFTPSLATLITIKYISPLSDVRTATGLRFRPNASRWIRYAVLTWLTIALCGLASPFVGAALGLCKLDLKELSALRAILESVPRGAKALQLVSIQLIMLGQVLSAVFLAPFVNAIAAFGEEWGWRGYLLPRLLPLGQGKALLLSGFVWGLWHAPVIALGYNYPLHPRLGILMMVVLCVVLGIFFGWTRLATGTIWPAVIGHATVNGVAGIAALVVKAGTPFDTAKVGLTGWSGWILLVLSILFLLMTGRLEATDTSQKL